MSQSGDTPQPSPADPFFAAYGTWPASVQESLDFAAFQAQCDADWRLEVALQLGQYAEYTAPEFLTPALSDPDLTYPDPVGLELVNLEPVSPATERPELIDGPPIPADLDLSEVFAAVPPEHLFDDDLREEFLYAEYLAQVLHADPAAPDPLADLSPFQRHQAQFVDRVLYFEKIIAWAQASKGKSVV